MNGKSKNKQRKGHTATRDDKKQVSNFSEKLMLIKAMRVGKIIETNNILHFLRSLDQIAFHSLIKSSHG